MQEAATDLIDQCSMIIKTEKEEYCHGHPRDIKSTNSANFNEVESQRILSVLEQDKINEFKRENQINIAECHMNLIEWMLYEIIQKENDNELVQSLKNISFIKHPYSKLKMKMNVMKYTPPTNVEKINLSKELVLLIDYFNEHPDLTTLLIIIKSLLLLSEYNIDVLDIDSNHFYREEKLSKCAALDANDFRNINEIASKMERNQTFESTPHVIPISGSFTKLTLYEIHGKANGFIGGVHIKSDNNAVYYETTVKGKDFTDVRIGWGLRGSELSKYSELVGNNKNSFVYEPFSHLLFHNASNGKSTKSGALDDDSPKDTDIINKSMKTDSLPFDPVSLKRDHSNSSNQSVNTEKEDTITDLKDDQAPTSDIDHFDPSLFDTDKDRDIKSFFSFIREEEELNIAKIRKLMIAKGLTFEAIEEFFDDELPNDSLLETILPLEKMDLDAKCDSSGQTITENELLGGIELERSDISIATESKFKSGSVVGCLLLPKIGELVFFIDGILQGAYKVNNEFLNLVTDFGWQPAFYSNKSSILEFNLGQSEFIHRSSVLEYVTAHNELDKSTDITSIKNHSISSFIRFDNSIPNEKDKKGIIIRNVTHDTFKSMTFETSIRLCNFEQSLDSNQTVTGNFTLFSVGEVNTEECDCWFNIGLDNLGCIFLEMRGCERVITSSLVTPNAWSHVALIYNYHRGSNKCNISILIDGNLKFQHEVVASKKNKITKLACKDVCIGDILTSNRPLQQLAHSNIVVDISHVRIWTTSRGFESIMNTLGRKKILGYDSDLVCELTFDEGCGGHIYDISRYKSVLRRKETIDLSENCVWLNMLKEDSESTIFNILHGINRHQEKSNLPLLDTFLSAIIQKIMSTSSKLLNDCTGDIHSTRKFQAIGSGGNYFMNPNEVDLWLIISLLRQIVSLEKRHLHTSLLTSLCRALFKVLEVVFLSIRENKEAKINLLGQLSQQSRDRWVNKINICLIYISSGFSNSLYGLNTLDLVEDAISLFMSGIEILVPSTENQFYLLECLLIKISKDKEELKTKLHADIFSYLANNIIDIPNSKLNAIFDPLLLILSISKESACRYIANLSRIIGESSKLHGMIKPSIRSVIEPPNNNIFQIKAGYKPVMESTIEITIGDIAVRGPDWIYSDEDGGMGNLGVVIEIGNWMEFENSKVKVMWKSGKINSYRWGVNEEQKTYFDICVYSPNRKEDTKSVFKSRKPDIEKEFSRKTLLFTIEEVIDALITNNGNNAISKRSILTYMKENSSIEWQEKNKIMRSVNSLIVKLDARDIVSIYTAFAHAHSNKYVKSNDPTKDLSGSSKIECRSEVMRLKDTYQQRINYFFCLLMTYIIDSKVSDVDNPLRILITGQSILLGISTSEDKVDCDILISRETSQTCNFIRDSFQCTDGNYIYWDWRNGFFNDKSQVASANVNEKVDVTTKLSKFKSETILNDISIDANYVGGNLLVTARSKSVEIIQSGDREWNTCISTTAIHPNTGVYKWYVKMKNFSERRGHCMIGNYYQIFRPFYIL